jgi:5-methylcytosine-specific restriction endonuclease McrA
MSAADRHRIRAWAAFRCEYCHFYERHLPFASFHLDHIVARQHGGRDEAENAAWSCQECNLLKGTNLSAVDPDNEDAPLAIEALPGMEFLLTSGVHSRV